MSRRVLIRSRAQARGESLDRLEDGVEEGLADQFLVAVGQDLLVDVVNDELDVQASGGPGDVVQG